LLLVAAILNVRNLRTGTTTRSAFSRTCRSLLVLAVPAGSRQEEAIFCHRLLDSLPLDLPYFKVVGDLQSESDVREVSSELDFAFALRQSLPQVHPESVARRIVGAVCR
jgi:hypothetical protein